MNIALIFTGGFDTILILPMLAGLAFWIWMLVDCATKEEDPTQKLVWVIIIAVTGIIGAPLYFFIRKLPRKTRRTV